MKWQYPLEVVDADTTASGVDESGRDTRDSSATGISAAVHHFRLRNLWSKIHSTLYSDITSNNVEHPEHDTNVSRLRGELDTWRATIPDLSSSSNDAFVLFGSEDWFEVNYSFSILMIHRRQLTTSRGAVPDYIFLDCLKASQNICNRYRLQFVGRPISYSWGALHFLFFAGLTYLHCLWASPAARQAARHDNISNTCTNCTMVLVIMAERWDGVAAYRDLFETMSSRTMTMMVDEGHREQTIASAWSDPNGFDPLDLSQWMGDTASMGNYDQTHALLAGVIGNFAPEQMDINDLM